MNEDNLTQNITISKEEYDRLVECRTTLLDVYYAGYPFESGFKVVKAWKIKYE